MKICGTCKQSKKLSEFNKNKSKKDGLSGDCRECSRKYIRNHYYKNSQYYKDRSAKNRKLKKDFVKKLKEKPCKDCEIKYPYYVMDFDHQLEKEIDISRAFGWGWEKLKKEIAKCDLVCSNCHRIRTFKRITSVAQTDEQLASNEKVM